MVESPFLQFQNSTSIDGTGFKNGD